MAKKKDDRRNAARLVREQIAKEQRRKKMIWGGVIGAVVLLTGGLIAWTLIQSNKASEVFTPANANKDGNAIVTGSGPVTVEDYVDFMCPHCKTFHDDANAAIKQLAAENKITFVQHPVAYLDRASTTKYSTRSSAASGCAADGGKFSEFADALFAAQPEEGSAGLSDAELIEIGKSVGLGDTFAQCVNDKRYVTWAGKVSNDATAAGITGTPTVLVNGQKVAGNTAAIVAAVAAAGGSSPSPSAS